MITPNVHQAKSNLNKLLNTAAEGDDVIITKTQESVRIPHLQPIW